MAVGSDNAPFYSSTLNGVELKVRFAFRKSYYTKNASDADQYIFYEIGTLSDIGWNEVNSATPKYSLNTNQPYEIGAGISMVQGQMIFKTFHHDSLEGIKKMVLDGINGGADKIEFPIIESNPFISLADISDDLVFDTHSNNDLIEWDSVPLFHVLLISSSADVNGQKQTRIKTIKDVKFTSIGSAESVQSLEMNTMASFMAIGRVTDWEEYK